MRSTPSFAARLSGGERRSIGAADAVAREIGRDPSRFGDLWDCLHHVDPLVRRRAADALEKATRSNAAALQPRKGELLGGSLDDGSAEVRWHLLALCSRLALTRREAERLMVRLLATMEDDPSSIVRVMALQAAVDIAARRPELKAAAARMLKLAQTSPVASLRARARKLQER